VNDRRIIEARGSGAALEREGGREGGREGRKGGVREETKHAWIDRKEEKEGEREGGREGDVPPNEYNQEGPWSRSADTLINNSA